MRLYMHENMKKIRWPRSAKENVKKYIYFFKLENKIKNWKTNPKTK